MFCLLLKTIGAKDVLRHSECALRKQNQTISMPCILQDVATSETNRDWKHRAKSEAYCAMSYIILIIKYE